MSGDRSREGRRLAAECLALARKTSDSGVRASLLEMAQKWLELAERCEHDAWNKTLRLRALQAAIGQKLRAQYELPQELSHRMLTLLMQLNAPQVAPDGDVLQVAQAYEDLVDCITPYHDQGIPPVPQLPENDGGAT
jgi:hypothetical protein